MRSEASVYSPPPFRPQDVAAPTGDSSGSRYVLNDDQLVLTAGRLTTPTGSPIYLGLVRNSVPEEKNPWVLNWVGERPSCQELPEPADLGRWPDLAPGREVVLAVDLGDDERRPRLPEIASLPPAAQLAALAGAIQWSLLRGLAVRQVHGGGRGYFAPVYLSSREDVALAPDLVAPIHVQSDRLIVRALLEPEVAYPAARAVVERWEQLPGWLLDACDRGGEEEQPGRSSSRRSPVLPPRPARAPLAPGERTPPSGAHIGTLALVTLT